MNHIELMSLSKLERALYILVDESDSSNKFSSAFSKFMMVLIILSVGVMALETDDGIYIPYRIYFEWFDMFTVGIFSLDYFARVATAHLSDPDYQEHRSRWKSIRKYVLSFYGIIDLLSILPFWLKFTSLDFRIVRVLRLLRMLRVFKIARYNNSIDLIACVFKEKRSDLGVTCGLIIIVMILASFIMYNAEHEAQPEAFPNVLGCIWWAIVTLTTIGYGDVYPVTMLGRIVGGVIAFLGVGLVAMPTGIISAGFLEKINKPGHDDGSKGELDECRKEIQRLRELLEKESAREEPQHKSYCPYCGHKLDD